MKQNSKNEFKETKNNDLISANLKNFMLQEYSGKDLRKLLISFGVKIISWVETYNEMNQRSDLNQGVISTKRWYTLENRKVVSGGDKYKFFQIIRQIFGDDFLVLWESNIELLPKIIEAEKQRKERLLARRS